MQNERENAMEKELKKRNKLFVIGVIMVALGVGVLAFFGYRKISRELYLRKLLKENINFEIPRLDIKVPVLEGTSDKALQVSAGHFEGTGSLGKGNYCICGHNSTIYAEIFNDLDQIRIGDDMYLVDNDEKHTKYQYTVNEYKIVEPQDVSVLGDFGDDRITVISCTDDGKQRQVVVGTFKGKTEETGKQ
ncbi:Sortase family protein [Ruminococcus flavefaciens]|uniref:Sortase family protein n=1 Tax=Ruminococcus flavefaciens TaxID=1265 RepID=A0A1H6KU02_RUMFL|nr:class D sortase [Ruminococcus flavefaciens]SEH75146.1 Sortase family protein [Ruminococcus flavefaciens]